MNLQPFDIERARQGVPVRTSGGHRARIVCWDMAASTHPIVALVTDKDGTEHVEFFTDSGHNSLDLADESYRSLMLCPDDAPAQKLPRTWQEFCNDFPVKRGESYIMPSTDSIFTAPEGYNGDRLGKTWCVSKGEAEAFLSLMQLRQVRKAWVGDWEPIEDSFYWGIYKHTTIGVTVGRVLTWNPALTFPTEEMAKDFLNCFRDLCETAKRLL